MDAPLHAADQVDKDETGPRIIAVIAGVVLIAIAAGALVYSGIWSPPATQAAAHTQTTAQH